MWLLHVLLWGWLVAISICNGWKHYPSSLSLGFVLARRVLTHFLVDLDHKPRPEWEMASAISSSIGGRAIILDIRRFFGDNRNRGKVGFFLMFLRGDAITDWSGRRLMWVSGGLIRFFGIDGFNRGAVGSWITETIATVGTDTWECSGNVV